MFKFLIIIIFLFGIEISAKPVSIQEVENAAINWMHQKNGKQYTIQKATPSDSTDDLESLKKIQIIKLAPAGWVVVSRDDLVRPIIAYGESPVSLDKLNPLFLKWIKKVDDTVATAVKQYGTVSISTLAETNSTTNSLMLIAQQWQKLTVEPAEFNAKKAEFPKLSKTTSTASITPLLWMNNGNETDGINWGQESWYNERCPINSSGPGGHDVTGCVATAMAQIMRYHQFPQQGHGSYNDGNQFVDFGATIYLWSSMPYRLDYYSYPTQDQIDAVSTLMYHAGVSVNMIYGSYLSSADPSYVPSAINDFFRYQHMKYLQRDKYSGNWETMLLSELEAKRPLFYGGSGTMGGHAFVLDGYDGGGYYHFNWGWNGSENGFFALNNLTPANSNFSAGQIAVKFIPLYTPPPPVTDRKIDVTKLYVATFLRASENAGLDYWVNSSLSIEGIAESFWEQPETQKMYPPGTKTGDFVNAIYWNLFNRSPDNQGWSYWVKALDNKQITPSHFILAVINGAQGTDTTILSNKTTVGLYFADSKLTDINCARMVMRHISETDASVRKAESLVDRGCQ